MSLRNEIKGQRNRCPTGLLLFALVLCVQFGACLAGPAAMLRGALLTATQADDGQLRALKTQGYNSVVLSLSADATQDKDATHRIQTTGFNLYYWIEIARNPALADSHPEWMASLQGHQEWRRFFPDLPKPAAGEVVKNYPWVPVFYQEAFAAHLKRVKELLRDKPAPRGIFLNDL